MDTNIDWQPASLGNETIRLKPLDLQDFDALYTVASDPLIWEQHPVKERYKKEVFQIFFEEAIASKTSFAIIDNVTEKMIGSTRYWNYHPEESYIEIGYTFIQRDYWGKRYNKSAKILLLNYAFQYVDTVSFLIGTNNIRSQKAIEKLYAKRTETVNLTLQEKSIPHYRYVIQKEDWLMQ